MAMHTTKIRRDASDESGRKPQGRRDVVRELKCRLARANLVACGENGDRAFTGHP